MSRLFFLFIGILSCLFFCAQAAISRTASFLKPVTIASGGFPCSRCLQVADFNGDGVPDVAFAVVSGESPVGGATVGVSLGNGDGTWRTPAMLATNESQIALFAADFNGDEKLDLLANNGNTPLFPGNGDGTFGTPQTFSGCAEGLAALALVADLNGDQKPDVICGQTVMLNDGKGNFHAGGTVNGSALVAVDVNRDNRVDLFLASETGGLTLSLGQAGGTFSALRAVGDQLIGNTQLQVADFNGDGLLDVLGVPRFQWASDGPLFLPGRGDGTFGPFLAGAGPSATLLAVADVNGDGFPDLVTGSAIRAGNGDGTFGVPITFGAVNKRCEIFITGCADAPEAVAIADLNKDGRPDLIVASRVDGQSHKFSVLSEFDSLLNDYTPGPRLAASGVSSFGGTAPVAPNSLVSSYGVNLAAVTATANATPLPETLGGVRVHITHRSGLDTYAKLLYVSPTQINFIMPTFPKAGGPLKAWIQVVDPNIRPPASGIAIPVADIAPSLASRNDGLAAATAVRVASDGSIRNVDVMACVNETCVAVPIDVTKGQVYLSLYGTGFDSASLGYAGCSVAGLPVPLSYAGKQGQFDGLDQVNLELPAALAGVGLVQVQCTFFQVPGNAVKIMIK